MKVNYYTRPGCELCVEGLVTLKLVQEDVPFTIEEINIEDHEEIHEQYMLMIPVVEVDGHVIQYGQLDYPTILEAFL